MTQNPGTRPDEREEMLRAYREAARTGVHHPRSAEVAIAWAVGEIDRLRAELPGNRPAGHDTAPPCTKRRWESITPTDDGRLIVDCAVHGEIGSVRTGGTLDVVGSGENEAVADLWAAHVEAGGDTAPPAGHCNPEFVAQTERVVRAARELVNDGLPGTTGLSMALGALDSVPARAATGPRAGDAAPTAEPDGEDDGILHWLVRSGLDVAMDNTSPGNIPARITVGSTDLDVQGATRLRDALTAAIAAGTES